MKNKVYGVLLAGATLWCLAILAGPLAGASPVYAFFALICHQDPARSWHLLGEPLPVCIRCASIYFAFLISLLLNLKTNVRWLRMAVALMVIEFVFARLVVDISVARALTGIAFGMAAAPFVKRGVGELSESL